MSSTKNLLSLYEKILGIGGLGVYDNGSIFSAIREKEDTPAFVTVNQTQKRLVLPTSTQLKSDEGWNARALFHPLKEDIIPTETPVIGFLRKEYIFRIATSIGFLMAEILKFSGEDYTNLQGNNPDSIRLFQSVSGRGKTSYTTFTKNLESIINHPNISFFKIYLKKSGEVDGKRYQCVSKLTFPLYEIIKQLSESNADVKVVCKGHHLSAEETKIITSFSKKDIASILGMYETIFPMLKQSLSAYDYGSNDAFAPFTTALVLSIKNIAECINGTMDILFNKNKFYSKKDAESMYSDGCIDTEVFQLVSDLEPYSKAIGLIPLDEGNKAPNPIKEIKEKTLVDPDKIESSRRQVSNDRWDKESIDENTNIKAFNTSAQTILSQTTQSPSTAKQSIFGMNNVTSTVLRSQDHYSPLVDNTHTFNLQQNSVFGLTRPSYRERKSSFDNPTGGFNYQRQYPFAY